MTKPSFMGYQINLWKKIKTFMLKSHTLGITPRNNSNYKIFIHFEPKPRIYNNRYKYLPPIRYEMVTITTKRYYIENRYKTRSPLLTIKRDRCQTKFDSIKVKKERNAVKIKIIWTQEVKPRSIKPMKKLENKTNPDSSKIAEAISLLRKGIEVTVKIIEE